MTTMRPLVDVFMNDDGYRLIGDFPGVAPEDFNVRMDGDRLILDGVRKMDDDEEIRYHRVFRLKPGMVDPDKLEARLEQGVLTLNIAKAESAKPRVVPVLVS